MIFWFRLTYDSSDSSVCFRCYHFRGKHNKPPIVSYGTRSTLLLLSDHDNEDSGAILIFSPLKNYDRASKTENIFQLNDFSMSLFRVSWMSGGFIKRTSERAREVIRDEPGMPLLSSLILLSKRDFFERRKVSPKSAEWKINSEESSVNWETGNRLLLRRREKFLLLC